MIKRLIGALLSVMLLATLVVANDEIPESIKGMEYQNNPYETIGFKEAPWTGWNKFWATMAVGGQVGDTLTTNSALDRGCVEGNPIFGKDADIGTIVAFKVVVGGIVYYLVEHTEMSIEERQEARNWGYGALGILGGGAAIWNSQQDCH